KACGKRALAETSAALLTRRQQGCRQQRQPFWHPARPAHFHLFKQKRRRNNRRWQSVLRRAKRSKRSARKSRRLVLHVVVHVVVVSDSGQVAQRARAQSDDSRPAHHLFASRFRIHFVHHGNQPIAIARSAAETRQKLGKIILMQQAHRGIIHLPHNQAVRQFFRFARINEFL